MKPVLSLAQALIGGDLSGLWPSVGPLLGKPLAVAGAKVLRGPGGARGAGKAARGKAGEDQVQSRVEGLGGQASDDLAGKVQKKASQGSGRRAEDDFQHNFSHLNVLPQWAQASNASPL